VDHVPSGRLIRRINAVLDLSITRPLIAPLYSATGHHQSTMQLIFDPLGKVSLQCPNQLS